MLTQDEINNGEFILKKSLKKGYITVPKESWSWKKSKYKPKKGKYTNGRHHRT